MKKKIQSLIKLFSHSLFLWLNTDDDIIVHSNIDKTPRVKELTNKLMEKHKNDELNGSD